MIGFANLNKYSELSVIAFFILYIIIQGIT